MSPGVIVLQQHHWIEKCDPARAVFQGRYYRAAKRAMDLGLVLLSAPLWLPLLLLLALLVAIESPRGGVLFTQERTGKDGKRFRLYKLRTMVPNAEQLKQKYMYLNELKWPDFKITNDPRVTRIGRFLRKTSLDELPQLLNVLQGDMSIVGPRPTSFAPGTYRTWQIERLDVKPGLTGLWQIMGRSSLEFDERVRLDILYINHRCLWLDVQILVRTIPAVLSQRGAA
jgi:lipopolysaccharide/colanic/teichoic acid biosynthesis glycosyltransferase